MYETARKSYQSLQIFELQDKLHRGYLSLTSQMRSSGYGNFESNSIRYAVSYFEFRDIFSDHRAFFGEKKVFPNGIIVDGKFNAFQSCLVVEIENAVSRSVRDKSCSLVEVP